MGALAAVPLTYLTSTWALDIYSVLIPTFLANAQDQVFASWTWVIGPIAYGALLGVMIGDFAGATAMNEQAMELPARISVRRAVVIALLYVIVIFLGTAIAQWDLEVQAALQAPLLLVLNEVTFAITFTGVVGIATALWNSRRTRPNAPDASLTTKQFVTRSALLGAVVAFTISLGPNIIALAVLTPAAILQNMSLSAPQAVLNVFPSFGLISVANVVVILLGGVGDAVTGALIGAVFAVLFQFVNSAEQQEEQGIGLLFVGLGFLVQLIDPLVGLLGR